MSFCFHFAVEVGWRYDESADLWLNSAVVGLWQLYHAMSTIWQLKQSLIYLIGKYPVPRTDPSPSPPSPYYLESKAKQISQHPNAPFNFPPLTPRIP